MQVSRVSGHLSPCWFDAGKARPAKNGKPVLKEVIQYPAGRFLQLYAQCWVYRCRARRARQYRRTLACHAVPSPEQERLDNPDHQADQRRSRLQNQSDLSKKEKELAAVQKKATLTKEALIHVRDLDYIGKRTFLGNYSLTEEEFSKLKKQADHGYMMDVENLRLKEELSTAKKEAIHWSNKYHDLWYDVKPYLDALHRAPELVRGFLEKILAPKHERTMNVPQRNRKRGQDMEL